MSVDPELAEVPDEVPVRLTVNGRCHELAVQPRRNLVDLLRRDLGLVGTNVSCEQGVCGACTVLVDGEPVRACLMLGVQADGTSVQTVESLATDSELNDLQRAFTEHHGVQCGFCTPGFLMLGTALLDEEPDVDRAGITEAVSANLCRCTGYAGIVDAIEAAARKRRGEA